MKTWTWCAVALSTLALAACGSSSSGGAGGSAGGAGGSTLTTTNTIPTGTGGTTTTGGDPCADGSDCSACADFQTCYQCNAVSFPAGEPIYNAAVECVICTACYTTCDGANVGCPSAPTTKDACDGAAADDAACKDATATGCQSCATAGTCKPQLDACKGNAECGGFAQALQACP